MAHFQYIKGLPNHSELYRDFHLIRDQVLNKIFDAYGWQIFKKKTFFNREQTTEFSYEIEHQGWDLAFFITDCPDKEMQEMLSDLEELNDPRIPILIEYKSSIEEWGKQVDEFIRQIKRRNTPGFKVLLTFDPRFKEYEHALWAADHIKLVVLPRELIEQSDCIDVTKREHK
jgi:hypothetical protein